MYADQMHVGYSKPGLRPGSLAIAIGINAGIFAALIFAAPEIQQRAETKLRLIDVPIEAPPPKPEPIRERHEIKPVNPRPERVVSPDPIVRPPATDGTLVGTSIPQPPPPIGNPGNGTDVVPHVQPSPPALPVLVGAEIDPRYAAGFQPTYPGEERRAGREGRVTVRVLIGVDGRVKQVERLSADSDAFFAATQARALSKWRFRPATRDGIPVESWRTMSVRFVLDES